MSDKLYHFCNDLDEGDNQKQAHLDFIDESGVEQTPLCQSITEVNKVIKKYDIEAVIIGSDAVVQHHTWLERIKRGNRKPFYIQSIDPDRMFPSMFWGVGFDPNVKLAMMSVSSQNSRYKLFSKSTCRKMHASLSRFSYISVRDTWTADLIEHVSKRKVHVTPDPVFAFNYNCQDFVNDRQSLLSKYNIPEKYILVCLRNQLYNKEELTVLKNRMLSNGLHCVAFPISTGLQFDHPFDHEIECPLTPSDWYSLIKYSSGYVGCNMHPIVVSLHNAVPCYSLDDYVNKNFWNKPIIDHSSKIEHIMGVFGIADSHRSTISEGLSVPSVDHIADAILNYPTGLIHETAIKMLDIYKQMMADIIQSFEV